MKQQKDKEFDKKLQSLLEGHQVAPPDAIWTAIDKELHPKKGKKIGAWVWAAASLIVLLTVVAVMRWKKTDKEFLPHVSSNSIEQDSSVFPRRSPTVIITNRDTAEIKPPILRNHKIEPAGKDSLHHGFEFKPIKQAVKLRREVYAKTDKIIRLEPLSEELMMSLKEDAGGLVLAQNHPKASINNEKITLKIIVDENDNKKLDINNLSFANAINTLTSKLDRSEDKFLHLKKDKKNKKVKGFSLDIVNLTITYHAKD